jgi:hypothetical protein
VLTLKRFPPHGTYKRRNHTENTPKAVFVGGRGAHASAPEPRKRRFNKTRPCKSGRCINSRIPGIQPNMELSHIGCVSFRQVDFYAEGLRINVDLKGENTRTHSEGANNRRQLFNLESQRLLAQFRR